MVQSIVLLLQQHNLIIQGLATQVQLTAHGFKFLSTRSQLIQLLRLDCFVQWFKGIYPTIMNEVVRSRRCTSGIVRWGLWPGSPHSAITGCTWFCRPDSSYNSRSHSTASYSNLCDCLVYVSSRLLLLLFQKMLLLSQLLLEFLLQPKVLLFPILGFLKL